MADRTKIEWSNATWNPITGCKMMSEGCRNCYAMKLAAGRLRHHPSREGLTKGTPKGPVWNGEVRLNRQWMDQPLKWPRPRRIFVCAHSDLFYREIPDEWIMSVFGIMLLAPQHNFQILTKRPNRAATWFARHFHQALPPHIWIGTSIENQDVQKPRLQALMRVPAETRWISAEPLLGPLDLKAYLGEGRITWVVVGGESGPRARPMELEWVEKIVLQCLRAKVPVFVKQLSAASQPEYWKDYAQFPDHLKIRQYPKLIGDRN